MQGDFKDSCNMKISKYSKTIIWCPIWNDKGKFRKTLSLLILKGQKKKIMLVKNQSMGDSLILNGYLIFPQIFEKCAYIFKLNIYFF
jgi:hypothetical protein